LSNIHACSICIIYTYMEGNIKIYRLPKGRGTDQWKWYCLSRRRGKYQFHGPHRNPGQSVYSDIAIHISNYCVYCIKDLSLTHHISAQSTEIFQGIKKPITCPHISLTIVLLYWISESDKHNINAQTFFKESRNLIGTAILYADIDRSTKTV
jgi:hypothetical protein